MSKYPHHHCRLQMSGHVSISAPHTKHICPPALGSESNPRLPRPRTGHTWFNLSTDVDFVWVREEDEAAEKWDKADSLAESQYLIP